MLWCDVFVREKREEKERHWERRRQEGTKGWLHSSASHLVGVLGDHLVLRVGHVRALHHERLVVERSGSHLSLYLSLDPVVWVEAKACRQIAGHGKTG